MSNFSLRSYLLVLGATLSIAACGGGGSSDTGSEPAAPAPSPSGPVAKGPYSGAAAAMPGTLEAENFDLGGEGVAYHDRDTGNTGGAYRLDEDVDIAKSEDSDGGDYDVSKFHDGEWLTYTIDVAESIDYLVEFRVAVREGSAALNVQLDGQELTGTIDVPNNGGKYQWVGRANVPVAAGEHTLTIQSDRESLRLNRIRVSRMPESGPYRGTPSAVPGDIEAEDFDIGGEGAAYHDETPANSGGEYRGSEAVDIATTGDSSGGFDVVDFAAGEWLVYTINVAEAGDYDVSLRAATTNSGAAYRIALDGKELAGPVAIGEGGTYAWTGPQGVALPAGEHELTISVEGAAMRVNALRFEQSAAAPEEPSNPAGSPSREPYLGSPAAIPGIFEAEDFDNGGQGLAYHDSAAGNIGGEYRPDEDVDIAATADPEGGEFEVNNIDTGEWLSYTVDVARSGNYDIELRVSSAYADSSLHVEMNDRDVTGVVSLPNTGDWNSFQWVAVRDVPLSAGEQVLKIVADNQYFNLNSVRVAESVPEPAEPPAPQPGSSSTLIFKSGFEGDIVLQPLIDCWGTGCWQDIAGLDALTSFNWPVSLNDGIGRFLMLTDPANTTALTMGDYMFNRIEEAAGPRGDQTQVLYQEVSKNANGTEPMGTSPAANQFQLLPKQDVGELYVSFWVKLQPDLVEKMNNLPEGPGINNGGTWRAFFALKTGSQTTWGGPADDGDYRIETYIMTYGGGQPYWAVVGDNNAGGGAPRVNSWSAENRNIPVPVGEWFKFEIYWKRSKGDDGRVWIAADGQVLADRHGPNMGAWDMPINRIMAPLLYSGSRMPIYQWIDDIEVWSGFPTEGDNPPYAAH